MLEVVFADRFGFSVGKAKAVKLPLQPVSVACYEKLLVLCIPSEFPRKLSRIIFNFSTLYWRFFGCICNVVAVAGELLLWGENGFQHADKVYYCDTFRVRPVKSFEY